MQTNTIATHLIRASAVIQSGRGSVTELGLFAKQPCKGLENDALLPFSAREAAKGAVEIVH